MKKSIELQVSELTSEQKNNIFKAYKKHTLCMISVLISVIILGAAGFFYFNSKAEDAEFACEAIDAQLESMDNAYEEMSKSSNGLVVHNWETINKLTAEKDEFLRQKSSYRTYRFFPLVFFCILGIIVELITTMLLKKKYPYYSEKVYKYLKKNEHLI